MIPSSFGKQREVMWVSLDEQAVEHLRLVTTKEGVSADGLIIHLDQAGSFRLRYRIDCDSAWQARKLEISRLDETANTLVMHSDGKGHCLAQFFHIQTFAFFHVGYKVDGT